MNSRWRCVLTFTLLDSVLINVREPARFCRRCATGAGGWIIHPVGGLWAQRRVGDGETLDYWGAAGTRTGLIPELSVCVILEEGKGRRGAWNFLFPSLETGSAGTVVAIAPQIRAPQIRILT